MAKHGSFELICDTSPLQYLHWVGLLEPVRQVASKLWIPEPVASELEAGQAQGIDLPVITGTTGVEIVIPPLSIPKAIPSGLGSGETAVLACGLEMPGAILALDDLEARNAATRLGLNYTGTLGLILDLKKAGLIKEVKSYFLQLKAAGFYVSNSILATMLEAAGQ